MNPSIFQLGLLASVGFLSCSGLSHAYEPLKDSGKVATKCVSVAGVLFEQQADKSWKPVKAGEELASGALLVGLPRVEFVSGSGAVKGKLLADVGKRGPFPVLEGGIILHDAGGVDLDLTFQRGLLVLENLKKNGTAKVRLHIRDETWVLEMQTPGARVGLEIFGRHPPGLPKVIDAKTDSPTTDVLLIVLEGQAFLDTGKEGIALHAPPGLARMHWDSVRREHTFQRLEKLPENLVKPLDDHEEKIFKEISAASAKLNQGDLGAGLDELLKSPTRLDRLLGVTLAGALDDLPRLSAVLMLSQDAATRDQAIVVLRHWLGREPGQVQRLQTVLIENKKLSAVQARNVLHLLFGFDAEERQEPNTYSVLLMYLTHKNQAVRSLAHWHLVRLAPAGKDIPFDAAGSDEQRDKAVRQWQALIPEGQLPPRLRVESPKQR